jgi:hypothetical protein
LRIKKARDVSYGQKTIRKKDKKWFLNARRNLDRKLSKQVLGPVIEEQTSFSLIFGHPHVAAADLPSSDWIFKVVWKCLWKIAGLMEDLFSHRRLVSWAYLRNGWLMVKEKEESES